MYGGRGILTFAASGSRKGGEWRHEDYDVLDDEVVSRDPILGPNMDLI
jgi:hypothetical protein